MPIFKPSGAFLPIIKAMKQRKRELAKVGVFGSIENPTVVKESDLKEIVETFKEIKKAPIKLGSHWSENRPRLGNVIELSYDEKTQTLNGIVEEHDVLSDAVDQGFYPDVSIGAKARASDGKMYLHHLAYLGDEPPAVKDLEKEIAEEMEDAEKDIAAADSGNIVELPSPSAKAFYLSDSKPVEQAENKEDLAMTPEEIKALQDENNRLKAENESKEKMLSDAFQAKHEADKEALRKACEGKVNQEEMNKLMNLADSFEQGKTIELSDSEGNKRSESPISILTSIFAGIKPKVEEGSLNLSDSELKEVETLNFSAI